MAFPADVLRAGVAIANTLTAGAQQAITHEPWTSETGDGTVSYGSPVTLRAVVDLTRKQKTTITGTLITVIATLTIVGDVAPNGATGRNEPIDPRDRITLPGGITGPIIGVPNAVVDPGTGRGFIHEITLGETVVTR